MVAAPGSLLQNTNHSLSCLRKDARSSCLAQNKSSTSRWKDFHTLERNEWKKKGEGGSCVAWRRLLGWFLAGHCVGTDVANEPMWGFLGFFFSNSIYVNGDERHQRFCPVSSIWSCFFCFVAVKGLQHYRMRAASQHAVQDAVEPHQLVKQNNRSGILIESFITSLHPLRAPRLLPLCLAAPLYRRLIQSM